MLCVMCRALGSNRVCVMCYVYSLWEQQGKCYVSCVEKLGKCYVPCAEPLGGYVLCVMWKALGSNRAYVMCFVLCVM